MKVVGSHGYIPNQRVVSKIFLFSPLFGEMIQIDEHIFPTGWNHQLAKTTDPFLE